MLKQKGILTLCVPALKQKMLAKLAWLFLLMPSGLVQGQWWWQRLWGSPGTAISPLPVTASPVTSPTPRIYSTSGLALRETRARSAVSAAWDTPGMAPHVAGVPSKPTLATGKIAVHFPRKTPMELDLEYRTAEKINMWKQKKAGTLTVK